MDEEVEEKVNVDDLIEMIETEKVLSEIAKRSVDKKRKRSNDNDKEQSIAKKRKTDKDEQHAKISSDDNNISPRTIMKKKLEEEKMNKKRRTLVERNNVTGRLSTSSRMSPERISDITSTLKRPAKVKTKQPNLEIQSSGYDSGISLIELRKKKIKKEKKDKERRASNDRNSEMRNRPMSTRSVPGETDLVLERRTSSGMLDWVENNENIVEDVRKKIIKKEKKDKEKRKPKKRSKKIENNPKPKKIAPEAVNQREQTQPSLERLPSFDSQISTTELNNQIDNCVKMHKHDRITDKNAFQIKMIDFLAHSLQIHNPNLSNLNIASTCLDISGKIYGLRVDKVYADLWKIFGVYLARNEQDSDQDDETNENGNRQRKKKKRAHYNILSTDEALKSSVDIYNPFQLINIQKDTLTTDMLFQARISWHVSDGVALNINDDVFLDKLLPATKQSLKIKIDKIKNDKNPICVTYKDFRFLEGVSAEEMTIISQKETDKQNASQYRFNLSDDDTIENDDFFENSDFCQNNVTDNNNLLAISNPQNNDVVDFQDVIINNPSPDANYEYSYLQSRHKLRWVGPSHWKIMNKDLIQIQSTKKAKTPRTIKSKEKKYKEMFFTEQDINKTESKFAQVTFDSTFQSKWKEDKILLPDKGPHDTKRFSTFFMKFQNECISGIDSTNNQDERQNTLDLETNMDYLDDLGNECDVPCHQNLSDEENQLDSIDNSAVPELIANAPAPQVDSENQLDSIDNSAVPELIKNAPAPQVGSENHVSYQSSDIGKKKCFPCLPVPKHRIDILMRSRMSAIINNAILNSNLQNVSRLQQKVDRNNLSSNPNLPIAKETPKQDQTSTLNITKEPERQEGFTDKNLVSMPKIVETANIRFALKPKVVDMRHLQKNMWHNIKSLNEGAEDTSIITLSNVYLNVNNASLSPALAFVSALHLGNAKKIIIQSSEDMSDIVLNVRNSSN